MCYILLLYIKKVYTVSLRRLNIYNSVVLMKSVDSSFCTFREHPWIFTVGTGVKMVSSFTQVYEKDILAINRRTSRDSPAVIDQKYSELFTFMIKA